MISKETLKKIQDFAISGDWNAAFAGTSYGNQHLSRMVRIALFLAKHEKADRDIVEAAAWLHDFPLTSGSDYDFERNQEVSKSVLDKFSLSLDDKTRIIVAAASHEGEGEMLAPETKVVHDADVLEKTGILGIIRHTWKLVHLEKNESFENIDTLANAVFEHLAWRANRLQTTFAKSIHAYLVKDVPMNHDFILKLVAFIQPLAKEDIITEKISEQLKEFLLPEQFARLQEQLSLNYFDNFID